MPWRYRDQIVCANPDQAQIGKLLQIARELKAQVVGDDGETYVLNRNWLGRERIETVRP